MQADQTMKAVTVGYFQQQHTLTAPCPVQFQTLCESSRLYEPGSQYMKFVKRLPQPQITRFSERDPFCFEPYTEGLDNVLSLEKQRKVGSIVAEPLHFCWAASAPEVPSSWSRPRAPAKLGRLRLQAKNGSFRRLRLQILKLSFWALKKLIVNTNMFLCHIHFYTLNWMHA